MRILSQLTSIQELYGPPPVPAYGPPLTPFNQLFDILPQILLIATLPIALTVGLVIYFRKKKNKKKHA